jgi:hypothetical protein
MESMYSDSDGEGVNSEVEGDDEVVEPQDAADFMLELEEEKKVQTLIIIPWCEILM